MSEKRQKVEIVHASGVTFRIFLTDYEISRANSDRKFADELADKYYELYQQGIVNSVESSVEVTPNEESFSHVDEFKESSSLDCGSSELETPRNWHERFKWSDEETKFLIQQYMSYFGEKRDKKKTSKSLYIEIAKKCNEQNISVTWEQVESKIKGLLKTYKTIQDNNKGSGRGTMRWIYFDIFDEFLGQHPEVQPVSVTSNIKILEEQNKSNNILMNQTAAPTSNQSNNAVIEVQSLPSTSVTDRTCKCKRKRTQPMTSLEPEWFTNFRMDLERRHAERMEILKDLSNTLNRVAGGDEKN